MNKKSDLSILGRMLRELGSMTLVMLLTILFGVGGFLAASAIAVTATAAAVSPLGQSIALSLTAAILIIALSAILRGFLRYAEQLSGHYIAFKILAILRDKLFAKLRTLAPAKLDTHEKGNLISVITSDIEMMEVFYAHTIAPVSIALICSVIYTTLLWHIHFAFGLFAAVLYLLIGFVLPLILKHSASDSASAYREKRGKNSAFILDTMRGLKEILQFDAGNARKQDINTQSESLGKSTQQIKRKEAVGFAVTDLLIILSMLACIGLGFALYAVGSIDGAGFTISVVLLISSFGPVVALSALSTTLAGTIASARRVFDILDEPPVVEDIPGDIQITHHDIKFDNVTFTYPSRNFEVLEGINLDINKGEHIAIVGESGNGKSTLLKLLMRFYDTDTGTVQYGGSNIQDIPTQSLRGAQSMLSQSAFLFNDTIENNIRMANDTVSMQDVINAAKKAAIHEAIQKLPDGYQTNAGELGQRFSSGEKQRIALARAFLVDSKLLLLDEPTSNLDVLSEAAILRSIQTHCTDKTLILVSHRVSTTAVCDHEVRLEGGHLAQIK